MDFFYQKNFIQLKDETTTIFKLKNDGTNDKKKKKSETMPSSLNSIKSRRGKHHAQRVMKSMTYRCMHLFFLVRANFLARSFFLARTR